MAIGVGALNSILNTPVLALTYYYLPSTLLVKSDRLVTLIQTWQEFLQPVMENPLVDIIDTHNEFNWSVLSNKLIAMLTAKDIIIAEASAFLANAANEGSSSSSSNTDSSQSSRRSIKSIETGPTRTEWYETTDSVTNSETLKNIASSFSKALAPGGIVELLTKSTCTLANRLGIYLPECGKIKTVTPFVVGGTPAIGSYFNREITWDQDPWEFNIGW